MYLKSIELQGFKSFASRTKMDFHDGVTGIVGPNGSGKSNVADAVRWVLGEQSAKSLRGGNMQDVIFVGTASRKPLGFASVSITLDNTDHQLNIDYPEVTVTRRLYRSGESEYLLNGTGTRLRDINELFYDTGIGKEGYSIIGQGQIDRIISDKPEDRRELFDEAVGIVKFKRRKAAALKKLENEEQNLLRVTDILAELTKQVGPLERQSEKAKLYLAKRDELKERDLALFSINEEKISRELDDNYIKSAAAKEELAEISALLEKTKAEYEEVEKLMEELDERILGIRNDSADSKLKKQELEHQINILEEQIKSAASNRLVYEEQIKKFELEKEQRIKGLDELKATLEDTKGLLNAADSDLKEKNDRLEDIEKSISNTRALADQKQSELMALIESRASIKGKVQKYKTLDEQIQVRASSLTARMLHLREQQNAAANEEKTNKEVFDHICSSIEEYERAFAESENELAKIKLTLTDINTELSEAQTEYHRSQSLLESLSNLAERYEGYGSSVKKIMELKDSNPGIHGVVAELISTDKKYETAIETALGGTLQNVVTDNEATAKYLIEYLKRGKYGRATFLPLTSMNAKEDSEKEPEGDGIIGIASDLVHCDEQYRGMVKKLLGRTYVIDSIDHAIVLGRKTKHKLRMVTLEGELFNVGGSMTGGAYRNNANLLGRKRQIEELEEAVVKSRKKLSEAAARIEKCKEERNAIRLKQNEVNEKLKSLYIDKNTAGVKVKVAAQQAKDLTAEEDRLQNEQSKLDLQKKEVQEAKKNIDNELDDSGSREKDFEEIIAGLSDSIAQMEEKRQEALKIVEDAKLHAGALEQKISFLTENIGNTGLEIKKTENDIHNILETMESDSSVFEEKRHNIEEIKATVKAADVHIGELEVKLEEALNDKTQLTEKHRDFFAKREEQSDHKILIEKECFRLDNNIERLETEKENAIAHLFEEYEMTPLQIVRKPDDTRTATELNREIAGIKKEIKDLGSVNVNAIEEYKEVRDRHAFLSAQYDDIVNAAQSLKGIIAELDKGMKKQFNEKFADIQTEFDNVFKQLFGGGKGTLELMDADDVLETGVRIIAQPPGKKLSNMMQLSGGEKALTAIALLFAIQNLKPSPFCLLDEIEAALDESNVGRFASYLKKLSDNTQFIVITHRRGTMNCTDRLYGITMQEKGISTMVSVDLVEGDLT